MATAYPLPKWGLTMEEGTIVEWNVTAGQPVREGDVLALVTTDKIEMEFESPVSGVVAALLVEPDATVPVGHDIIVIADDEPDYQRYRDA
ncbi:MAG: DUF2118 domain-containing protein [Nocardioidaceae bacterium]